MQLVQKVSIVILVIFLLKVCVIVYCKDPCETAHHDLFPESGSRNTRCTNHTGRVCDYYLVKKWYVAPNSLLLNHCPKAGSCGVPYPTWMKGDFPSETDGIVNRTACTYRKKDCCKNEVHMLIKNCSTFYAYFLRSLPECTTAYCFESSLPCDDATTEQPTTSTAEEAEKPKGETDKGLLIGLLTSVAVLLVLAAVILTFLIKSKSCRQKRNSIKHDARAPSATLVKPAALPSILLKEPQQNPPTYEESLRSQNTVIFN